MKAKDLMKPRFEVIADYPHNPRKVGELISGFGIMDVDVSGFEKYPHLFKKLNWWEHRKKEDMPKKLICKAIENDTEIIEIEEWDMENLFGWRNKKERKIASLQSFNPKFGYFPVD